MRRPGGGGPDGCTRVGRSHQNLMLTRCRRNDCSGWYVGVGCSPSEQNLTVLEGISGENEICPLMLAPFIPRIVAFSGVHVGLELFNYGLICNLRVD